MPRKSPDNFDRSAFTAIRAEDLDAIAHIKASLVAHYQPANSEELYAIERIALARHSLLRTYRLESGLISFGLQKALQLGGVPEILKNAEDSYESHVTKGQEESFWMATGFSEVNRMSPSCWHFFLRYQAQTERSYRRALEEFERLRRHRDRTPEQIDPEPEPAPAAHKPPDSDRRRADPRPAAPAKPAALPRRVSHRRSPARVPRTARPAATPPAALQAARIGCPNAP